MSPYNTSEELLADYGLTKEQLEILYNQIKGYLSENDTHIVYKEIVQTDRFLLAGENYLMLRTGEIECATTHMTCYCKDLMVCVPKMNEFGGVLMRLYDLIHIAYGHVHQWAAKDENSLLNDCNIKLKFYGSEAYELGKMAYFPALDKNIIRKIKLYEEEAIAISKLYLLKILSDKQRNYAEDFISKVNKLISDFSYWDLVTHLFYCSYGRHKNVLSEWGNDKLAENIWTYLR